MACPTGAKLCVDHWNFCTTPSVATKSWPSAISTAVGWKKAGHSAGIIIQLMDVQREVPSVPDPNSNLTITAEMMESKNKVCRTAVQNCNDLGLSKPCRRSDQSACAWFTKEALYLTVSLTGACNCGSLNDDFLLRYTVGFSVSGGTRQTLWQLLVTALIFSLLALITSLQNTDPEKQSKATEDSTSALAEGWEVSTSSSPSSCCSPRRKASISANRCAKSEE
mmetsp:Transcript_19958/g.44024  ORF Transcript_19958/g.44024 Transcript_19958/m.44024 type:complete len:223 (-) Transcript_19958:333-1001(-)